MKFSRSTLLLLTTAHLVGAVNENASRKAKDKFKLWTKEKISSATPRDLRLPNPNDKVVGNKGNRYLKKHKTSVPTTIVPTTSVPTSIDDCSDLTLDCPKGEWPYDYDIIANVTGRILFEMPGKNYRSKKPRWITYVCSGTIVYDDTDDISMVITAAHCVYDDVSNKFARNAIFIPNQDKSGNSDYDCTNDVTGCWSLSFGAVAKNYAEVKFPENIPYDYAYYVVNDYGAHTGNHYGCTNDALDCLGSITADFKEPTAMTFNTDRIHAIGYPYDEDPNLIFCSDTVSLGEDTSVIPSEYYPWVENCEMTGGSSGGCWIENIENSDLKIVSVNSWGFVGSPGMSGPRLGAPAQCVFDAAKVANIDELERAEDGYEGIVVDVDIRCP